MAVFQSKPLNATNLSTLSSRIKKRPFLFFGLPFIITIVAGSFGLQSLTQTRYDMHNKQITTLKEEEKLGMSKNRRKINLQEEYWRLQQKDDEDWEPVRIKRPPGIE